MEFDNQKMRLTNQLEFERSRDTMSEFDWLSCHKFTFCCITGLQILLKSVYCLDALHSCLKYSIVGCNVTSHSTHYRSFGVQFYGSHDPTNTVMALTNDG